MGAAIWGVLALNDGERPWAYILPWRYAYVYTAIGILAFVGVLFYQQRFNPQAVIRQQSRVILWGSLLAFGPVGVWLGSPLFGLELPWRPELFLPLLLFFPLSISVAILRYRLWDVDVIVNRTLVYGLLTVTLGLVYFLSVMGLHQLLRSFTRQTSELAAVIATLAIVSLFNPLRKQIQSFIDRRFYRRKYDAAKTVAAFSRTLREEVDLQALVRRLEAVIRETIMPAHVSIWLLDGAAFRPQPSLAGGPGAPAIPQPKAEDIAEGDALVENFMYASAPVELEKADFDSPGLRSLKAAGFRIAVPLMTHGRLVGWLALGARLSEGEFTADAGTCSATWPFTPRRQCAWRSWCASNRRRR